MPRFLPRAGRRPATVVLALLATVAVTGCGVAQSAEARVEQGRSVYLNSCGRCHQADGGGFEPTYPQLAGNPLVTLHDPRPVIDIVLEGSGGMPGFRESLSREELAQVVSYIRNAWGNDASVVEPERMR